MLPLRSHGQSWGLVEIYIEATAPSPRIEIESAQAIVDRVGELLAVLEHRI